MRLINQHTKNELEDKDIHNYVDKHIMKNTLHYNDDDSEYNDTDIDDYFDGMDDNNLINTSDCDETDDTDDD